MCWYKESQQAIQIAVGLEPENKFYQEIAFFFKAEEMQEAQNYQASNECYTKAISYDPNYPSYYHNRGNNYYIMGKYPEAALDYQRAINLKPDHAFYHKHHGDALQEMGQLIAARQAYKKAAGLDPKYVQDHENFIDSNIVKIHQSQEDKVKLLEQNHILRNIIKNLKNKKLTLEQSQIEINVERQDMISEFKEQMETMKEEIVLKTS